LFHRIEIGLEKTQHGDKLW